MTTAAANLARFEVCLPFTLAQECPFPAQWNNPQNYSNDAHDPGGATQCGITQREYDAFRKAQGLPVQSVALMLQSEGYEIYYTVYWRPYCPQMPAGLDLSFFDASVNEGTHEAIRILQVALNVENDGEWGPVTANAIARLNDTAAVIRAFTERRNEVYRELPGYAYFGTGWERRAAAIGAESLAMEAS